MTVTLRTATKVRTSRDPRDRAIDHYVIARIGGIDFWTPVDTEELGRALILKLSKEVE